MNKGWKKVFAISLAATAMAKPAGTGKWQTGHRFAENPSNSEIDQWVSSLNRK